MYSRKKIEEGGAGNMTSAPQPKIVYTGTDPAVIKWIWERGAHLEYFLVFLTYLYTNLFSRPFYLITVLNCKKKIFISSPFINEGLSYRTIFGPRPPPPPSYQFCTWPQIFGKINFRNSFYYFRVSLRHFLGWALRLEQAKGPSGAARTC